MGQGEARWACHVRSRGFVSRLLMVVVAVVVVGPANAGPPDCSLNDMMVMANFNSSRYAGHWYGILWIYPEGVDLDLVFTDYYHEFGQPNSDGRMDGYFFARNKEDPNDCHRVNLYLTSTGDDPAKMTLNIPGGIPEIMDYWVLDTDYATYVLAFSCFTTNGNGTCDNFRGWLWSRNTTLPRGRKEAAENTFREMCMDMGPLDEAVHGYQDDDYCHTEPTGDSDGTASTLMSNDTPFFWLLLPCLLLNARVVSP